MMYGTPHLSRREGRGAAGHVTAVLLLATATLSSAACGPSGGNASDGAVFNNCDDLGEDFFAGMSKTSPGGVTMEIVSADPAPPANSDRNTWTVKLTDSSSAAAPIEGATLIVAPYMPQHGHGAANIIAAEDGGGSYTLSPIYLKMTGLWEVTLKATPLDGTESRVMFPFCIPPR